MSTLARIAAIAGAVLAVASGPVVAEPRVVPAAASTAKPLKPRAEPRKRTPGAPAVLVQYQRVGRELMRLQALRGFESCGELWPQFRAIKLDAATSSADARLATFEALESLQQRIDRMRGIEVSSECLNNPLADACR